MSFCTTPTALWCWCRRPEDNYSGTACGPVGLLGIGLAFDSGIAKMALKWIAESLPAKHLSHGSASVSTNPYAWERLPFVSRTRRLLWGPVARLPAARAVPGARPGPTAQ